MSTLSGSLCPLLPNQTFVLPLCQQLWQELFPLCYYLPFSLSRMIPHPFTRIILSLQIPLQCSLSLPRANIHVFALTSTGRGRALSRCRCSPILLQFWVSTSAPSPLAFYLLLGFLFGVDSLCSSLLFPQVLQYPSCQGLCPCGARAHHSAERHDRSITMPGGTRAWSLHVA